MRFDVLTAVLVLGGLLSACGGGGGGGDNGPDETPPTASIVFPPASDTLTDQATVAVSGVASDDREIAEVRVNGDLAITTDGFATWHADVPLPGLGAFLVRIDVMDTAGNEVRDVDVTQVRRIETFPNNLEQVACDPATGIVYAVDTWSRRECVYAFDMGGGNPLAATGPGGTVRLLSGLGHGGGPAFEFVSDVMVEDATSLLVVDRTLGLMRVGIATGDRTIVSGPGVGGGPFGQPYGVCPAHLAGHVFMTDPILDALLLVQLASGFRAVHSDDDSGGDDFDSPEDVVYDSDTGSVYVWDDRYFGSDGAIVRVSVTDGSRTVVPGSVFGGSASLALYGGLILQLRSGWDGLCSIDPSDGTKVDISGRNVGAGYEFENATGICVDGDKAYVSDIEWSGIFEVDLASGDRVLRGRDGRGDGVWGPRYSDIAYDWPNLIAVLTSNWTDEVIRVSLVSGERVLVTSNATGAGDPIDNLVAIDIGINNGTIYYIDDGTLVRHWGATGIREVRSGPTRGSGPPIGEVLSLVVDTNRSVAYVLPRQGSPTPVLSIDLVTGDRTEIGLPPPTARPYSCDMCLDPSGNLLIAVDDPVVLVGELDPDTGALSDVVAASTSAFSNLDVPSIALDVRGQRIVVRTNVDDPADVVPGRCLVGFGPGNAETPIAGLAPDLSVRGRGPGLPQDLGVDPATGLIYGIVWDADALSVTDPRTGDTVFISR